MKFSVSKNTNFNFLLLFVVYSATYILLEWPYIDFMYTTRVDAFHDINDQFWISQIWLHFLNVLKQNLRVIQILILLKLGFYGFLLSDQLRRTSAVFILTVHLLLLNLNSNSSPEMRYLNLLLIIVALYPKAFNFKAKRDDQFEPHFITAMWLIFGLSYSITGLYKLISEDWISGVFLLKFAKSNHNFNESLRFIIGFPWVLKFGTYFALFAELLALPLCLHPRTRFMALLNLTLMQAGLLLAADIYQITLGMLVFHVFMMCQLPHWVGESKGPER